MVKVGEGLLRLWTLKIGEKRECDPLKQGYYGFSVQSPFQPLYYV
jgi:hypothetical protein